MCSPCIYLPISDPALGISFHYLLVYVGFDSK
uniref:Uncharacterized protein n=1 Tax=Rhizophora mucronata TaxID=61149 RepID=A0A2P2IVF7_RHIMU